MSRERPGKRAGSHLLRGPCAATSDLLAGHASTMQEGVAQALACARGAHNFFPRKGERETEQASPTPPMGDSDEAPPPVHRRPPRPARGSGGAVERFAAALRRRVRSGASVAARASFAADSGDESAASEPSSSSRLRDTSGDASSAGGAAGGGDFSAFTFRAAAPVHRKAKESPLSSDAIFKQVRAGPLFHCRAELLTGIARCSAGDLAVLSCLIS